MFSLKEFVKGGFIKAVGKMADYQIILNAASWLEKGVLSEADLAEIQIVIDSQYAVEEEITEIQDMIDAQYQEAEEITENDEQ